MFLYQVKAPLDAGHAQLELVEPDIDDRQQV
jgi:hypothetical protein